MKLTVEVNESIIKKLEEGAKANGITRNKYTCEVLKAFSYLDNRVNEPLKKVIEKQIDKTCANYDQLPLKDYKKDKIEDLLNDYYRVYKFLQNAKGKNYE